MRFLMELSEVTSCMFVVYLQYGSRLREDYKEAVNNLEKSVMRDSGALIVSIYSMMKVPLSVQ